MNLPNKSEYIHSLFDRIAVEYDRLNRVMSLGTDLTWRRRAAELCALQPGQCVLDAATGTGDLAFALAEWVAPHGQVIGIDFSEAMLSLAQQKAIINDPQHICRFQWGDVMQIPFSDHTFHVATIGFALRNVVDLSSCLAELYRVVKPGGRVVCLELAKPEWPIFLGLHAIYLHVIIPWIGYFGHGSGEPYRYLARSLDRFPHRTKLVEQMIAVGFQRVSYVNLLGGVATIHVGER